MLSPFQEWLASLTVKAIISNTSQCLLQPLGSGLNILAGVTLICPVTSAEQSFGPESRRSVSQTAQRHEAVEWPTPYSGQESSPQGAQRRWEQLSLKPELKQWTEMNTSFSLLRIMCNTNSSVQNGGAYPSHCLFAVTNSWLLVWRYNISTSDNTFINAALNDIYIYFRTTVAILIMLNISDINCAHS